MLEVRHAEAQQKAQLQADLAQAQATAGELREQVAQLRELRQRELAEREKTQADESKVLQQMAPIAKMHTLGHDFVPEPIHAGGLRYHGMSPLVSLLKEHGYIEARSVHQRSTFEAGVQFARAEGILPAPEPTHAIRIAIDEALAAKEAGEARVILFNLCGHGHFDLSAYERQVSNDLLSQAEVLGRAAAPALSFNDPRAAEKDLSVMQVRPGVLAAALYTREGKLFAGYARPGQGVHVFPPEPGADGYAIDGGNIVLFRAVVENNERLGTVYLYGVYDPWDHLSDYLALLAHLTR